MPHNQCCTIRSSQKSSHPCLFFSDMHDSNSSSLQTNDNISPLHKKGDKKKKQLVFLLFLEICLWDLGRCLLWTHIHVCVSCQWKCFTNTTVRNILIRNTALLMHEFPQRGPFRFYDSRYTMSLFKTQLEFERKTRLGYWWWGLKVLNLSLNQIKVLIAVVR